MDFAAFAGIIQDRSFVLLPAGGLNSGYPETETVKWTKKLAEVAASGAEKLTEKMGDLQSGQKNGIVYVIDGDTLEPGRYTEAVLRAAREASAAGHEVIFLVATSPCMQWGEHTLEGFRSFGFRIYRVSISYANINRTAAFLETYAYLGNDFYGENWRDGEKFKTTFGYFFLAAYVQCALHNAFATCTNVVIMPKTFLVDQAEQFERVHTFRDAKRRQEKPAITGGISFLEIVLSQEAHEKFPIPSVLPTLQQLIECCVCKVCGKAQEGPYDVYGIGPVCSDCETVELWAERDHPFPAYDECEHVFFAYSEHVMDTVLGEEALECPQCQTVAIAYDNVNGEQADY